MSKKLTPGVRRSSAIRCNRNHAIRQTFTIHLSDG